MAVSMESWGGAEGNAGRLVFGKLQRTPGEPPPYIQHPALGTYIMILSSPHPSAEPPSGALESWWAISLANEIHTCPLPCSHR